MENVRTQKNKEKGNGEGTIYTNKKTGLLIGQYVVDGKRKSVYQRKKEKKIEFKKRFTQIINSINEGNYIEKSDETLYEILEHHIAQKHIDGITSENSFLKDKETLQEIEKTCKDFIYKPIQKINIENIEKDKVFIREYSQSVIDKIWALLKKGFKIAYSRRKINFNIFEDETLTKPISIKDTKPIEALDEKELKKINLILDEKERNHKYRNIVKLQLETGMRIGEVLALSTNNINRKNKTILVDKTLTKNKKGKVILGKHTKTYNKKTNIDRGKRTIKMNNTVFDIVNEQLHNNISNIAELLFWDYENNTYVSYTEINSWLKRLNEKYKITPKSLCSHVLRHTRITEMRKAGMDMKAIQYLVGHVEGSKITDNVYTTLTPEFLEQELKKIN